MATCLDFMLAGTWVSARGLQASGIVQYLLVRFQFLVLGWFVIAAMSTAAPAVRVSI